MSNAEGVSQLAMVRDVSIPSDTVVLDGELNIPKEASGTVLFAHGSGSSRHSPRNRYVARMLREAGIGTLLFDLLTPKEEVEDMRTGHLRFNIVLLAQRLLAATNWIASQSNDGRIRLGYFGASTGGGAALVAAAEAGQIIGAVVSRGGRPDLAANALSLVKCPTLLIVGGQDEAVIRLNRDAFAQLQCEKELSIVPGASHLFEEPGALEEVARLASGWFRKHLG